MIFGGRRRYSEFFQPQGEHPDLRWGVGNASLPITEGPGQWGMGSGTTNWHMEIGAHPQTDFYEIVDVYFGAGSLSGAGAVGTGVIDVLAPRRVRSITFDDVFGSGFYTLRNSTIRITSGDVTVRNPSGAEIESGLIGGSGLDKYGQYELRLPSASAVYSYSGTTSVREGVLNLQGSFEYLPNSDAWNIYADFTGTIGLANSGRMQYGNNPQLTGKTINIVLTGSTRGRWDCGRWTGTLGGTIPTFKVNGVAQTGISISQQYFKYIDSTKIFYYNPDSGTGSGYVEPAYGVINNWSNAFVDTNNGAGSWTVPADVYVAKVWLCGAGGGGGGTPASNIGTAGGGGAGGMAARTISVLPGQTISYSLGNGGGSSNNSPGGPGGDSTCTGPDGLNMRGNGGDGGLRRQNGTTAPGGAGGTASGGDVNSSGGRGGSGPNMPGGGGGYGGANGGNGGTSANAGGGPGGCGSNVSLIDYAKGIAGAGGWCGGKGPGGTGGSNGLDGNPGCGGGGANSANTGVRRGGSGGDGFIIIAW